jgi:glucose/mannose-6-phosphate isomerase
LLGDFVSLYLAYLNAVDPTPVTVIEYFKQKLGS